MKRLLLIAVVFYSTISQSQVWQSIGGTIGSSVAAQELWIDETTGDLFVAVIETGTARTTVRKWVGNSWVVQGTANFGPLNSNDLRITSIDGVPYVAIKYLSGAQYRIRAYRLNSGTWTAMGSTSYITQNDYDFSFKKSPNDGLYLSFYNITPAVGSNNTLITLEISNTSEGQIGGIINSDYYENHDFVIDDNDDPWVAYEVGDMSNYVNLSSNNYPEYDYETTLLNDWSGKIVTNLRGSNDLRFASHVDDDFLGARRYNLSTGVSGTLYTIYNSPVTDYDMASTMLYDYFFYSIGATHIVERMTAVGTQITLGTNFGSGGAGSLTDPRIEVWNDRVVVSYIRNAVVHVMELDNSATVTLGPTFGACEQVLTTASTPSFIVNDNNYSHANLTVTMASTDGITVPNPNVNVVGAYPNYYLQFTSTDISVLTNVEFEFETIENGISTNYELFFADVSPIPTVTISLPNNEVCSNHGLINLVPYASPAGGFWSGPGVSAGKFNPLTAGLGAKTLTYTYSNSYGCTASQTFNITVNPVPVVSVVTTPATCGNADGAANASITGGTPGYTFYWSNGASTEDISNVVAGMYYINVTDSKGCVTTKPATVATNGLTLSATTSDVQCFGASTGAVNLTITSGSGVASILWSNGATTEDLSGISAGSYEVTVTATNGCVSTASYEVASPPVMVPTSTTVSASCATNNGSATIIMNGGTAPYFYDWFNTLTGSPVGTGAPTLTNIPGGAYFAIIEDANGCLVIHNTMVSEVGGPDVIINSVTPAGCADDGAINVTINSSQPIASIEWNSGQTVEDISSLSPGFYSIEVTDVLGCVGMAGVDVPAASPDLIPICLVTVDTLTNTNLLVWEKPVTTDIDYFNIYRETSVAGIFQFVTSVPYADESVYNDLVASPQVRSWRYKLSAVNLCGEESDLSEFHKTIHLTIGFGLGNTVNLNWDSYEGFAIGTYDIYRYTNTTGWQMIQAMPSNLFSYVDSPPHINGLDYIISITPPAICSSTNKAQDYNSSRSNKTSSITGDLVGLDETNSDDFFSVFPNPSNGEFTLFVKQDIGTIYQVVITDIQGRQIMTFESMESASVIDLTDFSDGVYNLQLLFNNSVVNKKIVKQ